MEACFQKILRKLKKFLILKQSHTEYKSSLKAITDTLKEIPIFEEKFTEKYQPARIPLNLKNSLHQF